MKKGLHPQLVESVFSCACGNVIETRSLQKEVKLEICSACHPFFTGRQKLVDSAGRVERFMRKYGEKAAAGGETGTTKKPKKVAPRTRKPSTGKRTARSGKKSSTDAGSSGAVKRAAAAKKGASAPKKSESGGKTNAGAEKTSESSE